MRQVMVVWVACLVLSASVAMAKRMAPAEVAPIRQGQIEYRAPLSQMGCIEAWDTKKDELIWRRQIYVVKYNIDLEGDVQDVFIKTIELKNNSLLVKNERKSEYELDLESLKVKVLKGSLVETHG